MTIQFFRDAGALRRWFSKNHETARELHVGYFKVDSDEPCVTWPESVDEALCVGWIDGVRRRVDDERYTIRFTPRRPGSIWSAVNIARVAALEKAGRMKAAGRKAFAARSEGKSRIYAYEQASAELSVAYAKIVQRNKAAWTFLRAQAPWYRKRVSHWVMGAKQEATREKRLAKLIEASAAGRRI